MPTMSLSLIVALVAFSRLLPHPPNFAAIGALALFAGYTSRSALGVALPLVALFLSDLVGHLLAVPGMGFYSPITMLCVYGGFACVAAIGRLTVTQTSQSRSRLAVAGHLGAGTLAGATVFFLLSNFGVFLGGAYGWSFDGLARCYIAALPFFSNTLAGDIFFSFILFGAAWSVGKVNRTGLTRTESAALVKFTN